MEERNDEVMESEVLTGEVVPTVEESSDSNGTLIGVAVGAVGTLAVLGGIKLVNKIKAKFAKNEDEDEEKPVKKSKKKSKKQVKKQVEEADDDNDSEDDDEE